MPFIALALIVAAAVGGGTSVAAQHALPGDALWGFKTEINERIAAGFAVGNKAQAEWNLSAAQTRLKEAQELAAKGKLGAEAQAKLETNFTAHTDAIAEHIAALQAKGDYAAAADVAARFQATVAKHVSTLTEVRAQVDTHAQGALGAVLTKAQATLDIASHLSSDASAQAAAH